MKLDSLHKTVFVIDRGPTFMKSSKQYIEHDVLMKAKMPGIIPAAPIYKTMWTCSVEAVLEYIRVIYDIFPVYMDGNRLFQIITSDVQAQNVNSWLLKDQCMQQMHSGLANIGVADIDDDDESTVMHGLSLAIEILCVPTEIQHIKRTSLNVTNNTENHGRIICLTSVKSESHIRTLEECVHDAIVQHNLLASSSDNLMPIKSCDLLLLHIVPVGEAVNIKNQPKHEVSSILTSEVIATQSGRFLYHTLMTLVQDHYGLGSTTVTGIPMKEEQNSSSSSNYDVELLHPREVHQELGRAAQRDGLLVQSSEIPTTKTITLKWCTPKTNVIDLNYNTSANRITPVDVNSRPSLCLTNFLLSGRSVLLEQPSKTGVKVNSHMLTSHGSEIFIHTLCIARSSLEDPPSISEGCGGRVTDYRITDFGKLMRENRLVPIDPQSTFDELPINKAMAKLERVTRKWPITINDTIIYKMPRFNPLLSLITKDSLTDDEVRTCTMAIVDTMAMENRNDALPVVSLSNTRGKGPKREELYRQMWVDLESLLSVHSDTSKAHKSVLEFLLQCRHSTDKLDEERKPNFDQNMDDEKMTATELHQRSEKPSESRDITKLDGTTPAKKFKSFSSSNFLKSPGQNLMTLWSNHLNLAHSKHHSEFAGRLESVGNIAELYPHLNEKSKPKEEVDV